MTDTCKDCGKPGFADSAGALQHDRRAIQGAAPDGKERRVLTSPSASTLPKPEKPPKRAHWLHSKWLGIGPQ